VLQTAAVGATYKKGVFYMIVRLWKAFAAGLVILVLAWFFILTNWPVGLQLSMVFHFWRIRKDDRQRLRRRHFSRGPELYL
jgi:hypothetical protein